MAQAQDAVWLPVLPSMKGFGPALIKDAGSEADKSGKSIGTQLGKAMVVGVAAAGAGLAAAGAALYKVGEVFDEVTDTIRTGTGATGKALDDLVGVAKNVGTKVPADFSKIGQVVTEVSQRMGLTGGQLETVASQYLEAGRILGQDVDVSKTSAALNAFKIEGADVSGALDHLFQVSQATGLGMNELADAAARNAPAMQTLGFSFEETTAMVGSFDKAGLNSSAIMASMSKGLVSLAKDGEQPAEAFRRVQGEISGYIKKGDEAGALNLASKVFGTRGATQFIGALKSGTLNLDDMSRAAGQSGDTILGVGQDTADFAEQWQLFKNNVLVWLEPMGARVFGALGTLMGEVTTGATAFGEAFSGAGTQVESSGLAGFIERVGFGLAGLWKLLSEGDFTGKLTAAFGWEEDAPLVGFLLDARQAAMDFWAGLTMNAGTRDEFKGQMDGLVQVGADLRGAFEGVVSMGKTLVDKLWEFRTPITVISGLILTALIPHWVNLGVEALKSAAKQKLAWATTQGAAVKSAYVNLWGLTTTAASWVIAGTQATIQAARIAAGWLVAMGPVGWIIGIVALLVGAFVAAYNNIGWFKDGVDAAMRWVGDAVGAAFSWIQSAIAAVVDWFTGTALPAWDAAVKSVGDFFNWLYVSAIKPVFDGIAAAITWVYESIIKPVFDGIAAAVAFVGGIFMAFYLSTLKPIFDSAAVIIGGFYMFFEGVFNLIVAVLQKIVGPAFVNLWNGVIAPVFAGIGSTINDWWNFAVGIFNGAVGFLHDVFAAVFTWLHDTVIKPVFDAISSTITWVWENVLKPTFDAWVNVFTVVIPNALNWLYDNAIKPIFDSISGVVTWLWDTILKPYFDFWIDLFMNKIPAAAKWLYENGIKPHFDNIGDAVKWVWDNVLKPVFDTLSDVITKTIPKAFEDGVAFIKTAWEKIQEIAKAPVRFVIDTVINDGLIKGFNDLARPLGVTELGRVALPAGFADGGYTGPGGKYQPAGIVHAGEVVWSQADIARWGGVGIVEALRKATGYVKGGLVNPLRNAVISQPFSGSHNGMDFAAPVGTPIGAAGPGRVSSAGWSSYGGGNEVHIDHPNGLQTWYAHLSSFAVKMGDMVRASQLIGQVGSTGNSTGPHLHYMVLNGGWPSYMDPAPYLSGGGEAGGGWNPLGGIIDGLLSQFKDAFPAAGLFADMAIGVGKKVLTSAADFIMGNGGTDNNTGETGLPYLYDGGGVLNPGLTSILNNTRKPEAIYTNEQSRALQALAARGAATGGGVEVNFNGNVGWDPQRVAQEIEVGKRRSQTMAGMDGVVFA